MKEILLRGFEYDLWANRRWLDTLGHFPDGTAALTVFEHILYAQRVWLGRCGVVVEQVENLALKDVVIALNSTWKGLVEDGDLSAWVHYANQDGDFRNQFGEVAYHVINHGTYHRGHLRALAEAQAVAFPETDYSHFTRQPS